MRSFVRFTLTEIGSHALRATLALLLAVLPSLVLVGPASAGTLTSATWTADDRRPSVPGARYKYELTTATAGTINRIDATVPTGTHGTTRYLALNGGIGNNASTPDSPQNSVSSNLDIRTKVSFPTWPPSDLQQLVYKRGSTGNWSYAMSVLASGNVEFRWSYNGVDIKQMSGAVSASANTPIWIRGIVDTGQANGTSQGYLYTSSDGVSWNSIGSWGPWSETNTIYNDTNPLTLGGWSSGETTTNTKIYFASVANVLSGYYTNPTTCQSAGVVACFDTNEAPYGSSSWASGSTTGETWTVNRSGTNLPADIASTLERYDYAFINMSKEIQLREIDRKISYFLDNPDTKGAGQALRFEVRGVTNTATAGAFASTITTFDNSTVPVAIDSGTTTPFAIAATQTVPTYRDAATASNASGNSPTTLTTAYLQRNWLILATAAFTAPSQLSVSCTDSSGNTYATRTVYNATSGNQLTTCWAIAKTVGAVTITQNYSGTTTSTRNSSAFWYGNVDPVNPLDAAADTAVPTASSPTLTTQTVTPTTPNGIQVAIFSDARGFNGGIGAASGFNQRPGTPFVADQGSGEPGARVLTASSGTNEQNYVGQALVFRAASIPSAVQILGQTDNNGNARASTSNSNDSQGSNPRGFNVPGQPVLDLTRRLLFITDSQNNRIAVYRTDASGSPLRTGADVVIGQTDLYGSSSNSTASTFNRPRGLAYDPATKRLFVADQFNHRVLVFDTNTLTTGMSASWVLGQTNFTSNGYGATANTFNQPWGLTFDATANRLWVTDTDNNRVLGFSVSSITNGQAAAVVLGQPDFVTGGAGATSDSRFSRPTGVAIDNVNQRLFVVDQSNQRVLRFAVTSPSNGMSADRVLGQSNFTNNSGGNNDTGFYNPTGVAVDPVGQRLFVMDRGNQRVLTFDSSSITNGLAAQSVIGQPDFATYNSNTAPDGLRDPSAATFDSVNNRLILSDENNHRVMTFSVPPANVAPGAPASLGQKRESDNSALGVGGWLSAAQVASGTKGVIFTATITDTDAGDTSALCVEVKPSAGTFDGTGLVCGTAVTAGTNVATTVTARGWADGTYKWRVRAKDTAGLTSAWVAGSTFGVDTVSPAVGYVYDGTTNGTDAAFNTGSLNSLSVNWSGFTDAGSGVFMYGYSLGTTPGGNQLANGVPSLTTSVTATGLSLRTGQNYYAAVVAYDLAGNISAYSNSNGQQVLPMIAFTVGTSSLNFNTYPTSTASLALTTQTNAYGGYNLTFQMPNLLTAGSKTIPAFSAPWSAPATWSGTGLGFTSDDPSVLGSSGYAGAKYAGLPAGTTARVADHASGVTGTALNETFNASFRMTVDGTQAAGTYGGTLVVTCNPSF